MPRPPKSPGCRCDVIHEEAVTRAKRRMPTGEVLLDAADFFRILGDSTRMGILCALSHGELCGCDLSVLLNMTQSAISHQLRLLKQSRLVRNRRSGKVVFYRLDDSHIRDTIRLGILHVSE